MLGIKAITTALALGLVSLACSCQADNRIMSIGNDVRLVTVHAQYSEPTQDPLSVKNHFAGAH